MKDTIFSKLKGTIQKLDAQSVTEERKAVLQALTDYIQGKVDAGETVRLNFICTHNSRRSHLAQVWAQVMAAQAGLTDVVTYSGGTEATALFPVVAETLKEQGFEVIAISEESNPVSAIKYAASAQPVICFSKTFDHPFNPVSGFAAILTCSQAGEGCPFIAGAEQRIPITYDDPKAFDNTPQQAEKYRERSLEIATEMMYVFCRISK